MVDICNVYCLNGCWALLLDCYGQKSNPGIESSIVVVDNFIVYRWVYLHIVSYQIPLSFLWSDRGDLKFFIIIWMANVSSE